MKVIAVWTAKGGVGKTATAVNLAHLAASDGLRTLLWDLDAQGAASFYLRVPPQVSGGARRVVQKAGKLKALVCSTDYDNLKLLPADLTYRHLDLELAARAQPRRRLATKLAAFGKTFDLVLIDCPPSVSLLSESVLRAADALLVPVVPSTLSLRTLDQVRSLVAEVKKARRPLLVPFLSMVDRRKRLHRELADRLGDGADGFLETAIPSTSSVERMGLTRQPVTATAPSSPGGRAFTRLWQELRQVLGLGQGERGLMGDSAADHPRVGAR